MNFTEAEDVIGSRLFGAEWAYMFDNGMSDRALEMDSTVRRAILQGVAS